MELGAFTVFLYMIKAREFLWELVEEVTGARLTISYGRVGGVKADLPAGFDLKVDEGVRGDARRCWRRSHRCSPATASSWTAWSGSARSPREETIAWAITGPLLRAVGVPYDVRKTQPVLGVRPDRRSTSRSARTATTSTATWSAWPRWSSPCGSPSRPSTASPAAPSRWTARGRPIDPAAYVDLGKQGKTEGLLLVPIRLSPNLQGQDRRRSRDASTRRTSAWCCRRRRAPTAPSRG